MYRIISPARYTICTAIYSIECAVISFRVPQVRIIWLFEYNVYELGPKSNVFTLDASTIQLQCPICPLYYPMFVYIVFGNLELGRTYKCASTEAL